MALSPQNTDLTQGRDSVLGKRSGQKEKNILAVIAEQWSRIFFFKRVKMFSGALCERKKH